MSGAKDKVRDRFWSWFIRHISEVNRFIRSEDGDRDYDIYDRLTFEIRRIHPDLTPELTIDDAETSVLVLSCDGRREGVPEVIALADRAPDFPGWRIQRFRSPMPDAAIEYEGLTVKAKDIKVAYSVDEDESEVHVMLLIDGYKDDDMRYEGAASLVMDHSIGEYNTIMHIGAITFRSPEGANPHLKLLSLDGLRELIERKFY